MARNEWQHLQRLDLSKSDVIKVGIVYLTKAAGCCQKQTGHSCRFYGWVFVCLHREVLNWKLGVLSSWQNKNQGVSRTLSW